MILYLWLNLFVFHSITCVGYFCCVSNLCLCGTMSWSFPVCWCLTLTFLFLWAFSFFLFIPWAFHLTVAVWFIFNKYYNSNLVTKFKYWLIRFPAPKNMRVRLEMPNMDYLVKRYEQNDWGTEYVNQSICQYVMEEQSGKWEKTIELKLWKRCSHYLSPADW